MRAKLLILASAIGSLGWGAVLPYQYAYAAETRGWGALLAAAAASLFSLGALFASPVAGRLADRFNPVLVAVLAQLIGAVAVGSLMFVQEPGTFLLGMLVFGLGLAGAVPAKQVLALEWSSSADRRKVFAYKFTGESLGMAAGAFLAGLVVDLGRADGLTVGFLMAAGGFVISSAIIALAGSLGRGTAPVPDGVASTTDQALDDGGRRRGALRLIFADPAMRWTAVVTIALALGFYAQFESGLPAYALTVLNAEPSVIGTAAAVNCLVIVALQLVVVKLTAKRPAATLLMAVGSVWLVSWLLLSVAQFMPGIASALFVMTYGIFAVGETVYSPVLNPLTASLAPAGMVGQTLGVVAALQTAFSAAGPLIAGVLLGAGLGDAFLIMHLVISVVAIFAAWRIRQVLAARSRAGIPIRSDEALAA
ncbi:MFS family permease [Arthrobacter woluwensis]|uniref:MFS transporter n=1 Tax=Arthrobacter woluwensis TaxID=156980 RepID=UPI00277D5A8D|nr:MFS transporter [Arthrobacter woluwensis]MDQ0710234.1 MFS family permease [Arthrobacter woluwensis]